MPPSIGENVGLSAKPQKGPNYCLVLKSLSDNIVLLLLYACYMALFL